MNPMCDGRQDPAKVEALERLERSLPFELRVKLSSLSKEPYGVLITNFGTVQMWDSESFSIGQRMLEILGKRITEQPDVVISSRQLEPRPLQDWAFGKRSPLGWLLLLVIFLLILTIMVIALHRP